MGRARRAKRTPLHNANDVIVKSEDRAGSKFAEKFADGAAGASTWPAAHELTRRHVDGGLGGFGAERADDLKEQYDELDLLLTQSMTKREPRSAAASPTAGAARCISAPNSPSSEISPTAGAAAGGAGRGSSGRARAQAKGKKRSRERDTKRSVPFKRLHNLP